MKNTWRLYLLAPLVLSLLLLFPTGIASAHTTTTASCGDKAISSSTMDGKGSTSANVSVTIWYDSCTQKFYASANSFKDANGFAFHGTVYIEDVSDGFPFGTTCNRAGICNTIEIGVLDGDLLEAKYVNNNGVFYSCINCATIQYNIIQGYQYTSILV